MAKAQGLDKGCQSVTKLLGAPIEMLRQYVQNQEAGLQAGVSDPGEI